MENMRLCIKFGRLCVECPWGCADSRRCTTDCFSCINKWCSNNTNDKDIPEIQFLSKDEWDWTLGNTTDEVCPNRGELCKFCINRGCKAHPEYVEIL